MIDAVARGRSGLAAHTACGLYSRRCACVCEAVAVEQAVGITRRADCDTHADAGNTTGFREMYTSRSGIANNIAADYNQPLVTQIKHSRVSFVPRVYHPR